MRASAFFPGLTLCALLAAPTLAADIPGTEFASGNWFGAAETRTDGSFLDCYVSVGYVNGEQLWIGLYDDDSLTVFLAQPGTGFVPGRSFQASLMTEMGYPIHGEAYAVDDTFVAFTLAGLDQSLDFLTQGAYLRLLGVGIDQSFDVRGMGGALAQARACLVTHGGSGAMSAAATTPAPAPATDPAPAPAESKPVLGASGGAQPAQLARDLGLARPPARPVAE
jgi:hypothetical protein